MILIPTYNRPKMLARLIRQLKAQTTDRIIIVNDGSSADYRTVRYLLGAKDYYYSFSRNHGKQQYYKVVNKLFSVAKGYIERGDHPEYIFKLDDDISLEKGAVEKAKQTFKSIEHPSKKVLRLLKDDRTGRASWGSAPDKPAQGLWKAGWIDMVWMCNPGYLNSFEWQLPEDYFRRKQRNGFWEEHPMRSSQVGKWLTLNTWEDGRFWALDDELFVHTGQESKMNPNERRINPL